MRLNPDRPEKKNAAKPCRLSDTPWQPFIPKVYQSISERNRIFIGAQPESDTVGDRGICFASGIRLKLRRAIIKKTRKKNKGTSLGHFSAAASQRLVFHSRRGAFARLADRSEALMNVFLCFASINYPEWQRLWEARLPAGEAHTIDLSHTNKSLLAWILGPTRHYYSWILLPLPPPLSAALIFFFLFFFFRKDTDRTM